MKQRTVLYFVLALTLASAGWTRVGWADSGATTGASIVEQIGCDQTVILPDGHVTVNRACQITDFINLFVYLSKWGMSILAVLALLMMVYGGFQFVTAGGRASKVDEGKRVIMGTVIGTMISLTAYVIINTTVTAVSGLTLNSFNPFAPVIGVVFGNQSQPLTIQGQTSPTKLSQPFSGQVSPGSGGTGDKIYECRKTGTTWEQNCDTNKLQADCVDTVNTTGGEITNIQKALNVRGCNCGTEDGCFGPQTVACVRQFQIANFLPPTGVVDATTKDRINNAGFTCNANGAPDPAIVAKLPATELATTNGSDSGCCVVSNGQQDLYCVNGMSTRACQALGSSNTLYADACGAGETANRCGFCSNNQAPSPSSTPTSKCFQSASPYWCTNIASQMYYSNGSCTSNCGVCLNTLQVSLNP